MKTLKVVNNDFVLESGRLVWLEGADALAQIVRNVLALFLGEWFIAPNNGIDWLGIFNQGRFLKPRIVAIIRQNLLRRKEILKIAKLEIDFNRATREMTINFSCETTEGLLAGSFIQ